ncbi:MAG: hypothetical protein WCN98_03125, partial [Verrucomicrobiaceae bacterium]
TQKPHEFGGGFLSPEPIEAPAEPEPIFGRTNTSIFQNLGLPTMVSKFPVPQAAEPEAATPANEPEFIKLGLAASLKNCDAEDLGTSPEHIPSWVQFSLKVESIRSQLATGRVNVPFDAVLEGLEPEVRGIFVKARPSLMVELASNEVFHALTSKSAEPEPVAPAFSEPVTDAPALDPFATLTQSEWKEAPVNKDAESRFWSDLPAAAIPPNIFTLAEPEAVSNEEIAPVAPAEIPSEKASVITEPVLIPANLATGAPEFITPSPVEPRHAPVAVQPAPARNDHQNRRLLLTVLLGTSDVPGVAAFASLTRKLPGVSAVLCIHNDQVVAADGDESCESERFLREAPLKMRMLPSLTALTGIEDTETLHIQSGQGEATFCLQGDVTLAVLHDPRRREPVLKEKITLLGRELASMLRDITPA